MPRHDTIHDTIVVSHRTERGWAWRASRQIPTIGLPTGFQPSRVLYRIGATSMTDTSPPADSPADSRHRTADLIFRGALAFNTALTLFWLATYLGGGSFFFRDYRVNWEVAGRIFSGVLFFYVIWGVIWWAIKDVLLRFSSGLPRRSGATLSRRAWTAPTT